MSNRKREFVTDGIYHLIQRGHNKTYIFNEQIDKAGFLEMIKKTREVLPFHVLYYVLMDNHYHLIVQMQQVPIGKAMHDISLAYSKYYNKKYHCSGSVYGQRFRAYPVDKTSYLLQLILYIANNPVKAGLVKRPSEYRWCAHLEVVSRRGGIVSTQRLFEILGGTAEKGAKVYNELIRQNIVPVSQAPTESDFIRERRADQLEALLDETIGDRTSIKHIRSGSRDSLSIQIRREFTQLATSQGFKTTEIAHLLNVTDRSIRSMRPVPGTESEVMESKAGDGAVAGGLR